MSGEKTMTPKSLMNIAPKPEIIFTHGQGDYLYDAENNAYLDFMQGWAVNALGHSPTALVDAIHIQASQLINPSPAFHNQPAIQLADTLCKLSGLDQVFFTNSGAEANEGAIKLARKWGQTQPNKPWKIITFQNGFHGGTLATMSASGKTSFEPLFNPKVDGFIKLPFNDIDAVKAAIKGDVCAVMLELIQGEAGVVPATKAFIKELRSITQAANILLIVDEVQTGVGRTGHMFCFENYQIKPDIMTLGKGLGGGVPIAAMLAQHQVCCFEHGDQGGTFNGNPLMTAAAQVIVDTVSAPNFLQSIEQKHQQLATGLTQLSAKFGMGEVRGQGLLLALDTGHLNANKIVESARNNYGLLINAPRENTLRFMPALNVGDDQIELMLSKLNQLLLAYP
ncbi:MAG: acetylornithine transaminase [Pontibacterium sp.]